MFKGYQLTQCLDYKPLALIDPIRGGRGREEGGGGERRRGKGRGGSVISSSAIVYVWIMDFY